MKKLGKLNIFLFTILVFVLVLSLSLTSCSKNEEVVHHGEDYCLSDSDCVPLPVCHPLRCINKDSAKNYDAPEICTMVFVENAAYSPDDCLCVDNHCINKNNQGTTTNGGGYDNGQGATVVGGVDDLGSGSVGGSSGVVNDQQGGLGETKEFSTWLFQLQGATYSSLLKSPVDLVVIDPDETSLTKDDVSSLNSAGKTVIAYLSIGEAENYRSYWDDNWTVGNPSFIDEENPDWEGNFKVHYWDPDWQEIILARAEALAEAGYDGLYLDIIDAYEYYEDRGRQGSAQEMIDFVKRIAERTKSINGDFLIIPQNSPELYIYDDYASSIDGLGKEDTWFNEASRVDSSETSSVLRYLDDAVEDGKFVLSIDYPLDPANICIYYSLCQSHGFACTVSDRGLDKPLPITCKD